MSAGYQVIREDLEQAYKAFYREERTLDQQRHNVHCPVPDCGDSDTTKACRDALDVVKTLFDILTKDVEKNGDKMKRVHENYSRDNADVMNLFNSLED
jgi:hypothetical protein